MPHMQEKEELQSFCESKSQLQRPEVAEEQGATDHVAQEILSGAYG